jgi:hypothetical protein
MFVSNAQAPGQYFCDDEGCQGSDGRLWKKNKRRRDADYQDNERRAQRTCAESRPQYWQDYRREYSEYTERNRQQQHDRDRRRRAVDAAPGGLANGDFSPPLLPLPSGGGPGW